MEIEFNKAIRLRDEGQFEEALGILCSLKGEGKILAAISGVIGGILLFEKGAASKAVPYFRQCVEISPSSERSSLGLFHSLWESGERVSALSEMRRFLNLKKSAEYSRLLKELGPELQALQSPENK